MTDIITDAIDGSAAYSIQEDGIYNAITGRKMFTIKEDGVYNAITDRRIAIFPEGFNGGGGGGTDVSGVTAQPSDVLNTVMFVNSSGQLLAGTMQTVTATLSNNVVTVPAGYIKSKQTLTVAEAAAPTVSGNVVTVNKGYQAAQKKVTVGTALAATEYTPGAEDIVIPAGKFLTGDQTIKAVAAGINVYKCTSVDTGMAHGDYENVSISGVTPSAMNTEYKQNDPMLVDFNRIWSAGGNSVGFDKANSAWCIYEGDGEPNYVNSLFYSKIEGMSAEKGSATDPFFWDAENTAGGNRMLTVDFNSSNAPYDEMAYGGSWNVYAKLKAGVEYTIGLAIPEDDHDVGIYYDSVYFYVYDNAGNYVANSYSRSTAINIGGKDCTQYVKYTPIADGIFRFNFYSEYNTVTTPFMCSPAPEVTTAPKTSVFEQGDNWKIGGGENAGVRVLSAGRADCVGDFTQIEGNGVGIDSVWQSADGKVYIYAYQSYGDSYQWYMGYQNGHYYYNTQEWSKDSPVHPAATAWTGRASSSYGDTPVVTTLPTTAVSGTPVLTPVEKAGRDALGYSIWSGVKMAQVGGVWQEIEERADNMKATAFTPAPGGIYSADGSVDVLKAYKGKKSLIAWGGNNSRYGTLGIGTTTEQYTPVEHDRVYKQIACYQYHVLAIDDNGHLWGWGNNEYRQLGDGTTTNRHLPVQIGNKVWKQVAVGEYHSVGLDAEGYLYVWGYNARGELGNGSAEGSYLNEPTKISNKKFTYIHAYYRCTFALDEDGYMWGSGVNTSGELGNGTKTNIYTLAKLSDKTWKRVYSGQSGRTYAIDTDGYLWGTGYNSYGCLGVGNSTSPISEWTRCGDLRWKKVTGGSQHTIAISEEGYLYACGKGYGTAGFGNNILTKLPGIGKVKDCWATYEGNFYIDEYGKLFTFTGSSTGYMFALPLNGVETRSPVPVLKGYKVEQLYCTIDSVARFVIVKE